jgi:hypothetical protein
MGLACIEPQSEFPDFSVENSLLLAKNTLFEKGEFPVLYIREFACNPLESQQLIEFNLPSLSPTQ